MANFYDTIVIGAGLAGLTAAAKLAKSGQRVLLIDRNQAIGGRARTDDLDGWLFNQGGHALYQSGVGCSALRKLGIEPRGEVPPAGGQLVVDGMSSTMPINALGLVRNKALTPRGKVEFAKLMAGIGKLNADDYASVTVDEWIGEYRPDVRAVLKTFVRLTTYSTATDVMSADAAIAQLKGGQDGVLYLHDGWAALCADIAATAEAAGATIVRGEAVTSVERDSEGFVVLAGEDRYAGQTAVVAAGGAELTARLLGIEAAALGDPGPRPEAAVLDLCLDAMPTSRFVLGVDEPTYFAVHSPPARLAPEGKVAAVAMRYLDQTDAGSAEEHRASLERVSAIAGAEPVVRSRFLRRMTVANGSPLAAKGGMRGRPSIEVPDMPGAFIAGDWVGQRGLLADAAIASGFDAAEAILGLGAMPTPAMHL